MVCFYKYEEKYQISLSYVKKCRNKSLYMYFRKRLRKRTNKLEIETIFTSLKTIILDKKIRFRKWKIQSVQML